MGVQLSRLGMGLLFALALALPAHAAPKGAPCQSEAFVKDLIHGLVEDATYKELKHDRAAAFMEALNAQPPVTHLQGDVVLLFRSPSHPQGVYMSIFLGGCEIYGGAISNDFLAKLLGSPT